MSKICGRNTLVCRVAQLSGRADAFVSWPPERPDEVPAIPRDVPSFMPASSAPVLFIRTSPGVDATRLDAVRRLLMNARENDQVNFITAGELAERLILRDSSHALTSSPLPLGD